MDAKAESGDGSSSKANRYVVIGVCWLVLASLFVPGFLLNVYVFAGINFPNDGFASWYAIFWFLLVYGSLILVVPATVLLVRYRDLGMLGVLALLAVPVILNLIAFVLYLVLVDRYGAICC